MFLPDFQSRLCACIPASEVVCRKGRSTPDLSILTVSHGRDIMPPPPELLHFHSNQGPDTEKGGEEYYGSGKGSRFAFLTPVAV